MNELLRHSYSEASRVIAHCIRDDCGNQVHNSLVCHPERSPYRAESKDLYCRDDRYATVTLQRSSPLRLAVYSAGRDQPTPGDITPRRCLMRRVHSHTLPCSSLSNSTVGKNDREQGSRQH